jgi:hypothetical protein
VNSVRAVFIGYLVVIVLGIGYVSVLGLTGR